MLVPVAILNVTQAWELEVLYMSLQTKYFRPSLPGRRMNVRAKVRLGYAGGKASGGHDRNDGSKGAALVRLPV
jgi:hypothetical protein